MMLYSGIAVLFIAVIIAFLFGGGNNSGPKQQAIQLRVDNKRSSHQVEGPNWVVIIALFILAFGILAAISSIH